MDANVAVIRQRASNLRLLSNEMRGLSNGRLRDAGTSIGNVWLGEASIQYLAHCQQTRNFIVNTANELLELASLMDSEAQIIEAFQQQNR
jgi:hypothetical protein